MTAVEKIIPESARQAFKNVQEQTEKTVRSVIPNKTFQTIREVQEGTEKRVKDLLDRGEESLHTLREKIDPAFRFSEDLVRKARTNAEWLQEQIELGVNKTLEALHIPTQPEVEKLQASLTRLRSKVNTLDRKLRKLNQEQAKPAMRRKTAAKKTTRTTRKSSATASAKA